MCHQSPTRSRPGFTLVELLVVIVILGLLVAFGVPRFIKSVERSKASEAFAYLSAVRAAQERHHARQGTYTGNLQELDLRVPSPRYFTPDELRAGSTGSMQGSWMMTLTRHGPSSGYGAYTVTFTEGGYLASESTIEKHPAINLMAN